MKNFRMMLPKGATGTPEHITALFEKMKLDKSSYQIGRTKVKIQDRIRASQYPEDESNVAMIGNLLHTFLLCVLN